MDELLDLFADVLSDLPLEELTDMGADMDLSMLDLETGLDGIHDLDLSGLDDLRGVELGLDTSLLGDGGVADVPWSDLGVTEGFGSADAALLDGTALSDMDVGADAASFFCPEWAEAGQLEYPGGVPEIVHGDPISAMASYHQQSWDDTCAIACQSEIIQEVTGEPVHEGTLKLLAEAQGWYSPGGGTAPNNVGQLLEACGIDTHAGPDGSVADLRTWLDQGEHVIVGVNAHDMLGLSDMPMSESGDYPGMLHAIRVTGIVDDPVTGETMVTFNDPDPVFGGAGHFVPVDTFMEAWEDSTNFFCVTQSR